MTLYDVVYAELEVIRQAHIVDDERIDIRLLERFTHSARGEFIKSYLDSSKEYIEETIQDFEVDVNLVGDRDTVLIKTDLRIPTPLDTKFGLTLVELYSPNNLMVYPFSIVPFDRLRYSGSGRFNQNILFVSYRDGYLYGKSKNAGYNLIETLGVRAILADPTLCPDYIKETSTYPINESLFQYILEKVIKVDIRTLMQGISDETNDTSGKID